MSSGSGIRVSASTVNYRRRVLLVSTVLDELGIARSVHNTGQARTRGYMFDVTGSEVIQVRYYDPESGQAADRRQRRFMEVAGPGLRGLKKLQVRECTLRDLHGRKGFRIYPA